MRTAIVLNGLLPCGRFEIIVGIDTEHVQLPFEGFFEIKIFDFVSIT